MDKRQKSVGTEFHLFIDSQDGPFSFPLTLITFTAVFIIFIFGLYLGISSPSIFNTESFQSNEPTLEPTTSPTVINAPTRAPTEYTSPSVTATSATTSPTEINAPTRAPTEYTSPSVSTTAATSESDDSIAAYSSRDINIALVMIFTGFSVLCLVMSIRYLMKYCAQVRVDPSRGTFTETLKEMGCKQIAICTLQVVDAVTDFMFASDLLLTYNRNSVIFVFGWVCFISGIFGVILFYVKWLLMRKVLYKVTQLKNERFQIYATTSEQHPEVHKKTTEIRVRNSLLLFIDLLTVALEDCPQVVISLLISLYSGFANEFALMSLAVSLLSMFWTPVAVLTVLCGLDDDPINVRRKLQNNSEHELEVLNLN